MTGVRLSFFPEAAKHLKIINNLHDWQYELDPE
jgi:hypothetical protein